VRGVRARQGRARSAARGSPSPRVGEWFGDAVTLEGNRELLFVERSPSNSIRPMPQRLHRADAPDPDK